MSSTYQCWIAAFQIIIYSLQLSLKVSVHSMTSSVQHLLEIPLSTRHGLPFTLLLFDNRFWSLAWTKPLISLKIAKIDLLLIPGYNSTPEKCRRLEDFLTVVWKCSHVVESSFGKFMRNYLTGELTEVSIDGTFWKTADNVRILVFGSCLAISSKASSSTSEGLFDLVLSSRLVSPSFKRLNHVSLQFQGLPHH